MDFEQKIGTTFLDYDTMPAYNKYHKYSHEKMVRKLLPVSEGGTIADLGCAGGTYYEIIKSLNYGTVYGIDLSAERLETAKKKGYITYNTLAQNLPFEDNSIDAMISIDMLVHVLKKTEREAIFESVYRTLKPNGCFIISIASKKGYIYGDYGVDKKTIYSNSDGIINDYCALMDFAEVKEFADKFGFMIVKKRGTQFDLKIFKILKRITKENFHFSITLPYYDFLLGSTFLNEYGKAAFIKLQKK